MKEIVKEHQLRPIILRFDLGKPQLDFEAKGLAAHYLMHDLTWDMRQQLEKHYQVLEDIDVQLTELEYMLLPIEQDLDILEVFLKIKDPSVLPFDNYDEPVEINIDLGEFFKGVVYHNEMLQDIHKIVYAEFNWFEPHFDMIYEKESWIDEQLWNDVHQIYTNYLDAQVDIVTLDRDQEEFRGALAEVFDLQDNYREYGDTLFGMFNAIHKRCESCYKRSEIVNKGLNDFDEKRGI